MTRIAQIVQELTVAIGETPILLRCQDEGFWEIVEQRYAGFVSEGAQPACTFDVEVVRPERSLSSVRELLVRNDGDNWRLERGDFRVEWNSRTGRRAHSANGDAVRHRHRVAHRSYHHPGASGGLSPARRERHPQWTRIPVLGSFRRGEDYDFAARPEGCCSPDGRDFVHQARRTPAIGLAARPLPANWRGPGRTLPLRSSACISWQKVRRTASSRWRPRKRSACYCGTSYFSRMIRS